MWNEEIEFGDSKKACCTSSKEQLSTLTIQKRKTEKEGKRGDLTVHFHKWKFLPFYKEERKKDKETDIHTETPQLTDMARSEACNLSDLHSSTLGSNKEEK